MSSNSLPLIQSDTSDIAIDNELAEINTPRTRMFLSDCDSLSLSMFNDTEESTHQHDFVYFQNNINVLSQTNDEEIVFRNNGYIKVKKLCDTLQGTLFKAIPMQQEPGKPRFVAIKKTNKLLLRERIAVENDVKLCVSENIIKEAVILRYLTVHNTPIGDYICKYIDFFESQTDYYLVTEYVASEMTLKQFISKSREYIKNGQLSIAEYRKMMKYMLWQLFVTVQWLHISCHCAHLDLCTENILVHNTPFIVKSECHITINPRISIKITDFGVAEVFKTGFLCEKQGLSIYNEGLFAPKVFCGEAFDARAADNWMLGIVLFECLTVGAKLYEPMTMYQTDSGYWSLHHHKLREYLYLHSLLQYLNTDSFSLLSGLLNVDQKERLKGIAILKHNWFTVYFKRYKKQIHQKFGGDESKKINVDEFPFYDTT